ncbi:response regulator transcription factor [Prolixibacteraceae bacterium JC049]|nr:response regulator transcription factor [Prolixibacteraceae bacterium JC049]
MSNKKIKVYVVEDDPAQSRLLQGFLKLFPQVETLGASPSAEAALDAILVQQPDLLFLDVDLKKASGLDLAKQLRQKGVNCKIVFTTAHPQYAQEAINVKSMDFLVKSFGIDQIRSVITLFEKEQAQEQIETQNTKIQLATPQGALSVHFDDIALIKSSTKVQTLVLCSDGVTHTVSKNIAWWEEQLVNKRFLKISRAEIINLKYATFIDKKNLSCTLVVNNEKYNVDISSSQMSFFEVTDLLDFEII